MRDLRRVGRERLRARRPDLETREATTLLAAALGMEEVELLASDQVGVAPGDAERYLSLLERRLGGEPFAYLIGRREFYGRDFVVDRRVLVPRPETEHLVAAVLASAPASARVVDVGTGSGCIALTLALERADLEVLATDVSLSALRVATINRARFDLDQGLSGHVRLVGCDLTAALRLWDVDCVVSNPPYVSAGDTESLAAEVRDHEPAVALFAEDDGLATIRRLLAVAPDLAMGARIVLEIGQGQLGALRESLSPSLELERVVDDYAGIPRVVQLRRC